MNARQTAELDRIEDDFVRGDLTALRQRRCPICEGRFRFSLYRGRRITAGSWKNRYACGGQIYCVGGCQVMLSLWDGVLPEWAEGIQDWAAFSQGLYDE